MSAAVSFAFNLEGDAGLNNKHNLSNLSNNTIKAQPPSSDGTDQICIFCHTPHSATPDSPLWSRPDPATSSFPIYGNPLVIAGSLGNNPVAQRANSKYNTAALYPNGASRMCLSCHDGVTAIGLLNDSTTINMLGGTKLNDFPSAAAAVIDLSTSHPISFVYDSLVLADLVGFTTGPGSENYGAGSYVLPDGTVDTPLDGQSRMQCTTCHDPHDDTRTASALDLPFWRQTSDVFVDEYEDVCNACHASTPGLQATNH